MSKIKIVALFLAISGTLLYLEDYFFPPETWESQNEKGVAAFHENHYAKAEKHFLKALALTESLDSNNPRLYFSLNQLAELYRIQSKFSEAELLLKRLLELDKKRLGPTHPNVAFGLNNLAGIYRAQGRLEEAEILLKQALKLIENSFGKDHPLVQGLLEHYAHLLQKMERHSDAEKIENRLQKMVSEIGRLEEKQG